MWRAMDFPEEFALHLYNSVKWFPGWAFMIRRKTTTAHSGDIHAC